MDHRAGLRRAETGAWPPSARSGQLQLTPPEVPPEGMPRGVPCCPHCCASDVPQCYWTGVDPLLEARNERRQKLLFEGVGGLRPELEAGCSGSGPVQHGVILALHNTD